MRRVTVLAGMGLAASLAGCATGPTSFPVEATRFHYDPVADRGTVAIGPLDAATPPGPEFQTYAAAVQAELSRLGFTPAAPGATPQFRVSVAFARTERALPPRRSPVSIGLGVGGFSGGGYRGGTALGGTGGVSFPVGGGHGRAGILSNLAVRIRRGPDAVWEGQAQTLADVATPAADANATAGRLAHALFAGFPGESGRTIEVR